MGRALLSLMALWAGAVVALSCGRPGGPDLESIGTGETALRTWRSFHVPETDRIPHERATNPGTPWGEYVGSTSCAPCHPVEHAKWRDSFHSRTLYDARPETVFGRFDGKIVDDPQSPFIVSAVERKDPASGRTRFSMQIRLRPGVSRQRADTYLRTGEGIPTPVDGEYEVIYAFGNRRHQPYVARTPDGQHWALPVFWNDVTKDWRYSGFRPYVRSCSGCHVTGIKSTDRPLERNPEKLPGTFPPRFNLPHDEEGWAEGAVGCEVCHGPGKKHADAVERVGVETYRRMRREGKKGPSIFDGRASQEQMTFQCDQCHDFFTESTVTFVPGVNGFTKVPWKAPIQPHRDPQTGEVDLSQFYADGSHKSPCSVGTVFRSSKMWREGVRCTDCHDPHGTEHWADLKLPTSKNELCLSCHERQFPTAESRTAHSHHGADSPGNLCVECHMPRHMIFTNGQQMMSDRIPKHDFSIPTGVRKPGGPPPSCNVCHTDRDDAWTQSVLRAWRERRPPPR